MIELKDHVHLLVLALYRLINFLTRVNKTKLIFCKKTAKLRKVRNVTLIDFFITCLTVIVMLRLCYIFTFRLLEFKRINHFRLNIKRNKEHKIYFHIIFILCHSLLYNFFHIITDVEKCRLQLHNKIICRAASE